MKKKEAIAFLKQGKKIATKEMRLNNDHLVKADNSNTVNRSWGGNENMLGDKYSEVDNNSWEVV